MTEQTTTAGVPLTGPHDAAPDRPAPGLSPFDGTSDGGIRTLPPLEVTERGVPVSPVTGEPRRPRALLAAVALLLLASLAAIVAFVRAWWQTIHVQNWPHSIHLLSWTNTRPGSWQSIVLAVVFGLIGLVMVAAPAICAHNAWCGQRWTRLGALAAVALECLAVLLNQLAWLALPFAVAGAVMLWLAPVGVFFAQWARFSADPEPVEAADEAVHYGPLPRYR